MIFLYAVLINSVIQFVVFRQLIVFAEAGKILIVKIKLFYIENKKRDDR